MTTDIFIRTYHNDVRWLDMALKSIHQKVKGYRNIIITIPKGEGHLLKHLTAEKVIEVDDLKDGYIGQQLTKLEAWKYTDADFVVFWDSDVIAAQEIDIQKDYFIDGKPIVYKTLYTSIDCPWQPITEKAVGFNVEYEYMRRLPLFYSTKTLSSVCGHLISVHDMPVQTYLANLPNRQFSEFNVVGAIAEKYYSQFYHFVDTEQVHIEKSKARQFWSWGGITDEVLKEIESFK